MRKLALLPAVRVERRLLLSFAFLFFMCCSTGTFAQVSKSPLEHRISFKVENATVTQSLKKLHDLTGINFSYRPEDLDDLPRVSLNLSDVTTRAIIEKLLEGSNMQYVESAGGNILVMQKPKKKAPVKGDRWVDLKGKVVDQKGNPLPRVSIVNAEHKQGITSNERGEFSLSVALGTVLNFSFAGMKSYNYTVKDDKFAVIKMDTSPVVMQEFVVTGYQTINKRLVTGAVTVLKPEQFLVPGVNSVDQLLQGKVPGMMTTFSSGSPSASPRIRIRGTSTILGNASPLWVVDGVPKDEPVQLSNQDINSALKEAQEENFNIIGSAIKGVNPNDIESITVLKDAAATSIYGVRAANGVIVIKTKRGKAGPLRISYSGTMGFTQRLSYNRMNLMNSKERIEVSKENLANGVYYRRAPFESSYEGLYAKLGRREIDQDQFNEAVKQLETNNTDWLRLLTRNAFNHNHYVSFSGGGNKTTVHASLSFNDARGSFLRDDVKEYNGRVNLNTQISSKVNMAINLSGNVRTVDKFYKVNPQDYALLTNRTIRPDEFYPADITTVARDNRGTPNSNIITYNIFNEMASSSQKTTNQDFNFNVALNYRIIPNLTYEGNFYASSGAVTGMSYMTDRSNYIARIRGYDFGAYPAGDDVQKRSNLPYGGLAYPTNNSSLSYGLVNQLSYNKTLRDGADQLTVTLMQEVRSAKFDEMTSEEPGYYPERGNSYYSDYYNAGGGAVPTAKKHSVISTNSLFNTIGWSLTGAYSFNAGKYVFNGNIRTDGSNRFGQYSNQRFLPVWSVGFNWDVLAEKWLTNAKWIEQFNVRATYGTQGTVVSQVGPSLIASYPSSPVDPLTDEFVLFLKSLPYPDLRWEKTTTWNIGVDWTFFRGRFTLSSNYYVRKTKDVLLGRQIPQENGVGQMFMNYGTLENNGIELGITVTPVKNKNFSWTQGFNFTRNLDKLQKVESPNTYKDYFDGKGKVSLPGMPYSAFFSYAFAGLDPQYGIPTFAFDKSGVIDPKNPATFLTYSGRRDPIVEFGSSTSIRYKAFSLMATFSVRLGNMVRLNPLYVSDGTTGAPPPEMNLSKVLVNRWRKPGDEQFTNIPSFSNWSSITGEITLPNGTKASPYSMYDLSDIRVVPGDFLRCNNIQLSYAISPKLIKKLGAQGMTLMGSVTNPFKITDRRLKGQDPETPNVGGVALPITPIYRMTFGIDF